MAATHVAAVAAIIVGTGLVTDMTQAQQGLKRTDLQRHNLSTAGDVLFVPAGAIHAARNVGAVNAAELATYIVEKGKPLLVPAD